jgi:hypothetical protein
MVVVKGDERNNKSHFVAALAKSSMCQQKTLKNDFYHKVIKVQNKIDNKLRIAGFAGATTI